MGFHDKGKRPSFTKVGEKLFLYKYVSLTVAKPTIGYCVPSKDSDLPGYPLSLIRTFAFCLRKKALVLSYCIDPKFSDRLVWANSADPDQTAPRGVV